MSKQFIIIEGIDATGKTTLAKFMAKTFNDVGQPAIYFHLGYSPLLSVAIQDYFRNVFENLIWCYENLGISVIMDRGWPSESIYALGLNDTTRQQNFNPEEFRAMLAKINTTYIYATCASSLKRHLDEKKDDYQYNMLDYNRVHEIYDLWWKNMSKSPAFTGHIYDLDYDGSNLKSYMERKGFI